MEYLMIFSGALIALLERAMSAFNKTDFSFKLFLRKNLPLFIFNLIAGCSFVLAISSMNHEPIMAYGENITLLVWLAVGALAHYVWKLIISAFRLIFKNLANKLIKSNGNYDSIDRNI